MSSGAACSKPRILVFDIETAPAAALVFGRWKTNVRQEQVIQEGYVLCAVGRFLNEAAPRVACGYGDPDDFETVSEIWKWLNEADVVIAHNGKRFDIPVMNARFLFHGLPPPAPYKVVDTLATVRHTFKFPYNGLDPLSQTLQLGGKHHTDFQLWKDCMMGKKAAWGRMLGYCKQDVALLVKLYRKLLPWISNHPNMALYQAVQADGKHRVCPKCGGHRMQSRGYETVKRGVFQRFKCLSCHGWSRTRKSSLPAGVGSAILEHA